jgi:hypothetical protein
MHSAVHDGAASGPKPRAACGGAWKRIGLGLAAVGSIAAIGLAAAPARADKQLVCEMKGRWVEANDDFNFQARYVAKDGPDTFEGSYNNLSKGTVALVKGVATKGTWAILLTYTDPQHKGQIRELVGKGSLVPQTNLIEIKGNYTYKQDTREIGNGTFVMLGTCK